jgi:hypothetical protein
MRTGRILLGGAGLVAGAYASLAAAAWLRYGRPSRARDARAGDALLDRFMPRYDIVERHHIEVRAPAEVTLAAAKALDLRQSPLVRAIFSTREWILGSSPDGREPPAGIVEQTRALGWGVLADVPDREIVLGAVTQPWMANVTFRAIPPDRFAAFAEPGLVKIAWTLRADPLGDAVSMFRTETRAMATDVEARRRFRRYWSIFSPGIIVIRWAMLGPVKREAERAFRA